MVRTTGNTAVHVEADRRSASNVGRLVEVIGRYSNTPGLLSDLRRTFETVTTIITEDEQPDITVTADRRWRKPCAEQT